MTHFRKKPVVIKAVQWTGHNQNEVHELVSSSWDSRGMRIHTLEGDLNAAIGDWIVRGVKGEGYPVKPDIFAATYEEAAQPEPAQATNTTSRPDALEGVLEQIIARNQQREWTGDDASDGYGNTGWIVRDGQYAKLAREALALLRDQRQTGGWRTDMENAPRDGAPFLYWDRRCAVPETVCFLNGCRIVKHGFYPYAGGNWFVAEDAIPEEARWQPLPAPPLLIAQPEERT